MIFELKTIKGKLPKTEELGKLEEFSKLWRRWTKPWSFGF